MPRTRKWIARGLLLAAPVLLAHSVLAQTETEPTSVTPPATPKHHHKSHKTQPPLVLPPLPPGPLSQLPMDQIPPTPAKVSFQDGLLTISAQNSTLGEILRDVRTLTGAAIEIPQGGGANERVVTHLGPGAPREVLASLLNGSSFNYVMVGSNTDSTAVVSVTLMPKAGGPVVNQTVATVYDTPQPAPVNNMPQPHAFNMQQVMMPQAANGQQPPAAADADDAKDDEADKDEADKEEKDDADNGEDQAQAGQGAAAAEQAGPQSDPNQPNAGPKTLEQILEMLRRQPGAQTIPPPQPPPEN